MDPAVLREHPFLSSLTTEQLDRLRRCIVEVEYAEDAFVFREGTAAGTLYLLRDGCVALEQLVPGRGVVQVESLCAGDILGLSWLLPDSRWTLDARCIGPVQAYALQSGCVRQQMEQDHTLGYALLTQVVESLYHRLARVRLQRLDIYKTEG